LSDKPLAILGAEMKTVQNALKQLGYRHGNIIMSISTLSLPVGPELKLTGKGLIDVNQQKRYLLLLGKQPSLHCNSDK